MMDHHASGFDLPSTHRLPTVSAAQALQDLEGDEGGSIPTGLAQLDTSLSSALDGAGRGGIQKGHVTEIWGPPGAGKTAFGIQLAARCLCEHGGVVWVDGFHRMPIERLRAVVGNDTELGCLDRFVHYTCPSLPHLIALLCRPTPSCVPAGTSLVVIDSLSALVNHELQKYPETKTGTEVKGGKGLSASARRLQVLQYISSSLQKLAATRDLAVVVLTQCATKMQAERGATLIPAINASAWEQGMSTRLVLFRDWLHDGSGLRGAHFAGIQKLNGKTMFAVGDNICAFTVEETGLVAVEYDDSQQSRTLSATPTQKRKLGNTDFEIADSDDEDYGLDDDEELPPMPSQWQGSEDLLLVRKPESDSDDHQEDAQSSDGGRDDDTEPASETDGPGGEAAL